MTNSEIKVGYLISYDYDYIKNSLPLVYDEVDYIAIAVDINRKTWVGKSFEIPDTFFQWLKDFDKDNKIHLYEDDFCDLNLTPMQCETRERNMLSRFMGEGGWHVQIDTDEYFIDFKGFKNYVSRYMDYDIEQVLLVPFYTIFKEDNTGFFVVKDAEEYVPVAFNNPKFIRARYTECKRTHVVPSPILHQSWAKDEVQIRKKIENWGHKNDFDTEKYFQLWKFVDSYTYKRLKNLHPLAENAWKELEYIPTTNIVELIEILKKQDLEKRAETAVSQKIKGSDFFPPIYYRIKRVLKRKLNRR
ncbi:hypothetical protein E2605_00315 [Dysgonomonas capnocytophagoides]|uniref:Uncharacterized protein n=1 Tax=Dysgonomonas capnocytophagoides TaxID=45254 RepID=A0A4Y8LBX3_9BACT|nr:hypothetical protein [Dysgonomonas capnocytophagoides]TFD98560.1 hypothetical protein E2605_00315 [Dysgonomonas capnocytophagoides]